MKTCAFFGHAHAPERLAADLEPVLVDLIENHGVTRFLVGNHGNFDRITACVLLTLQQRFPHVKCHIVAAYHPTVATVSAHEILPILLPNGIEKVPYRYAIVWRNQWMLTQADVVVTHVIHAGSRVAALKQKAERQHKTVINLP